jgi:hypothetical protein
MSQTIKERINAKIEAIKQSGNNLKNEVILAKDSISHAEKENSKLMIALGYYSAVLKELIKNGYETVYDIDLIKEHNEAHVIVNNLFKFASNTANNFLSPDETTKKRVEAYDKIEKLYNFCIENGIETITIKLKQGFFKKKMELDLQDELRDIINLRKECMV